MGASRDCTNSNPIISGTELHVARPGKQRMKGLARSYVWYPGIDKELEGMFKCCRACQINRNMPALAPLHSWAQQERP